MGNLKQSSIVSTHYHVLWLQAAAGMEDFTHGVAMLTAGGAFRVKVDALQAVLAASLRRRFPLTTPPACYMRGVY
jgi:hypothetical protein